MRRIDQQWGAARALLGLGDLARFRNHPGEAHGWYVEALAILREIGARPEIARCLAGLGRVAMELGATEQARRHLTRSLRLSHATGARISVARGLEAFAALAGHESRPELAVQLAAAAAALRERAGLPPSPGARTEATWPRRAVCSETPPSPGCGRAAGPCPARPRSRWPWTSRCRRRARTPRARR